MTKQYEVTGVRVSFGPGFLLQLTEQQAQSRLQNLKKQKDGIYKVVSAVEFKRGEVIGVPGGAVPKALTGAVAEVGDRKKVAPSISSLRHQGFGRYDVLDADGVVLTEKPLPKAEAQAFLDKLTREKGL